MVRDNSRTFGDRTVKAIREYLKSNQTTWPKLTGEIVALIIQSEYESFVSAQPELPFNREQTDPLPEFGATGRPREKSTERDPLFDRLALLTGSADLGQITKSENRTIAVALAEIKKATKGVTADEIERRCIGYKRAHLDWPLTPTALAKHWSEFASPEKGKQKLDPYKTPENWQHRFRVTFPGIDPPENWLDLNIGIRADVLRRTT